MGALSIALGLSAATSMTLVPIDPTRTWARPIAEAARRFGIPEDWIGRVMRAESGGRTMLAGRPIRSPVGAIGLMQLMPVTWAEMRERNRLGFSPDDPHDNILAGAAYLRAMYDRFGYPGLFAAYNAGPGRYAVSLAIGRRLPDETRLYLHRVLDRAGQVETSPAVAPPPLFVVRHDRPEASVPGSSAPARSSLFALRSVAP